MHGAIPLDNMATMQNKNEQPLVSFIVTTYNLPTKLLRECLQSILALSLSKDEREIIVIDDGSEMSPLNDLVELQDDIVYIRQRNMGLPAARNMGLICAQGKFIQFVDGDDYLIQMPYEHCLDIARYQEADIILFHETKQAEPEVPFEYDGPMTGAAYMHQYNLRASACGYLFNSQILRSLRFTPGLLHEDEEFTPQLFLRAEHVFYTKSKAYYYRQRSGSITNDGNMRHNAKRLNDTEQIILRLLQIAQQAPEMERVALNRRIAQLTMDYLYNIIQLTHSARHLNEAIDRLSKRGLFPLPDKNYTKKYTAFRKMVNTRVGRRILLLAIR
jgi:glycosyltransferase involved in cell wall biosynthesis